VKLVNEFTVDAPPERTWQTLLDVERVAGALPGATIEPVGEDGAYRGQLRIKVGPVNMAYSGTVRLVDVDADSRVASFDARAKETRGTGTAAAVIRNRVEPDGSGTKVTVETELNVTGRPAQFGRGLMEDVAQKMLGDFASRLEQTIAAGPAEAAAPSRNGRQSAVDEHLDAAHPAAPDAAARDEDEASFDVGSMLVRGYAKQLGVAALVLALVGLLLNRRSKGFTFTLRYRP
jgi:carbon monoxide dehydrogenase subunit G